MKVWVKKIRFSMMLILITASFALALMDGHVSAALACNYYASPTGGGNGLSQSSPFKVADFWRVAGPGRTLCLLDGVYPAAIHPPQHLNGTHSARITVRALNDGKVRIDGGGSRIPVEFKNNDYFVIDGINAHNSSCAVVQIGTGADYNIFRRVIAWDARDDANCMVWNIVSNTGNLLEDVVGFGTGRKTFQWYSSKGSLTIRRAWGRWERSTIIGPKMVYSLVYHSFNAIYENVIGTWDESLMGGIPVNQPYGIISMDSTDPDVCVNGKYFGSIGYIRAKDKAGSMAGVVRSSNDTECLTFQDVVAYIEPGSHQHIRPFSLLNDPGTSSQKFMRNATVIGGASDIVQSQWQVSNRISINSMTTAPNIWTGTGARVCKRYVNGRLTDDPLWPWPMNQRIIDAMRQAGKAPVDVTRTMEEMFGTIPGECRVSSSGPATSSPPAAPSLPLPASPGNLSIDSPTPAPSSSSLPVSPRNLSIAQQ